MSGSYSQGRHSDHHGGGKIATAKRSYFGLGLLVGLVVGLALFFGLYFGLPPPKCAEEIVDVPDVPGDAKYDSVAVASDAGPCSVIGADMLRKGGSVVDAAIATAVCGGLYNPQSAGVGGGSFTSVYDAESGQALFINSRETAPLAATEDMYKGNAMLPQIGALAVAVPGEVAGYWEAHQRFGKLPWADLFEPSIELAQNGIRVSDALERDIKKEEQYVRNSTFNLKPIFVNPDGTLKKEGDTVVRPAFAMTLRAIADEGASTFYNGTLADRILADLQDAVELSIITKEDLQQYKVEVKPLLNISLDGYTVFTPGPPSSGPVMCLIMNILNGYGFNEDSIKTTSESILTYHRIVEAFKFAYAHRSQLGDEGFNDEVKELVANMTSAEYASDLRQKISDDTTHPVSYYGGEFANLPNDHGTSHVSVVGSDGSAVSTTGTINTRFGSKIRGIRTGIIFNNEMDDFSSPNITNYFGLPPSPNNFIAPGKRPISSMTPTLVLENGSPKVKMATGASGGTKITTGTSLVIMNTFWFGNTIQESTSKKRLHHQLMPNYTEYQADFDQDIIAGLEAKGHYVESYNPPGSVVQSILRNSEDKLVAVCDDRKGGYPDGF